jgi:tetratricopeptide (TPR) repeat protein
MTNPSPLQRAKRARLGQVFLVYAGACWGVLQVVDFLGSLLSLPDWVLPVAFILLLVGLVVMMATAWIQSLPSTTAREEAGEVPSDWQIAPGDVLASLKSGQMPHLTWGRAIMGGVVALSLLFGASGLYVVTAGRGGALGPSEAGASEAATGIAVVPFSVNGPDLEVWREGMVDVLSTSLDGLGGFRAIDSRTVLAQWHGTEAGKGDSDLDDALRVAGTTGARYALVGSAVSFGDQVRLTADIYDVGDGSKVGQARREGRVEDVLSMTDGLAVDVIRALLGTTGADMVSESQVASLSTSSLEALRDYLEGEALIRTGEFERAASAFESAVDQDSTFASAYYRLTQAYGWMEAGGDRVRRAELALRALRENLPARDRLLLEGEEGLATGDLTAIPLMEDAVKRYPDDPDAWILLGEHYVHLGDRLNRTLDDTWRAFSMASELDPTFSPTYIHFAETAARLGRIDEARSLIGTYLSLSVGTHQGEALSLGFALQFGDPEERVAALAVLDTLAPHTASDLTNGLGHTAAGLDALHAVAEAQWHRSRSRRWAAEMFRSDVSRGRVDRARQLWGEGSGGGRLGIQRYVLAIAMPDAPPPVPSIGECEGHAHCLLLAAADAIDRSDPAAVTEIRAAFDAPLDSARAAGEDGWERWLTAGRDAVGGYQTWKRGDLRGAARSLAEIQRRPVSGRDFGALLRLWLGEIALEEGRTADALEYLVSLEQYSPFGWYAVFLAARAHDRAGDAGAARREYDRFLDLWSEAPADHPYMVEAARRMQEGAP